MRMTRIFAPALVALMMFAARAGAAGDADPATSVRAYGGLGAGVAGDFWSSNTLRLDLDLGTFWGDFDWASVGGVFPFAGEPGRFIGARVGYQLEYEAVHDDTWVGSRAAHAADVGLVGRIESAGGSAFEAQAGVEAVFRGTEVGCCDSERLRTASAGVRVALLGEAAITHDVALVGHFGLRTGDHLTELTWLPAVDAGLRYRF